jgi:hypothetical protein
MLPNNDEPLQRELIDYMFRRHANGQLDAMACLSLWFGKSHDTDFGDSQTLWRFSTQGDRSQA